ncbi:ABC transporter substrate-binding protein [Longispora albida]|uniref:ABC transporter substrate-binding protein n=1 Tax=Longispora albida TaxID=203523 RepID=UPI0003808FE9|nr:ABC transporter substrate-binding protein [Longispora albida]
MLALTIGLAATTAGASACSSGGDAGSTDFAGEIVIGANLELSGPAAGLAVNHSNALKIAAEQANENGIVVAGKLYKIKLVMKDNGGDPAKAAALARELAAENAAGMIGASTTPVSMGLLGPAEELGLPTVTLAASDALVKPVEQRKHFFKVSPNGSDIALSIADRAQRMGGKKIGILATKGAYGDLILQFMKPAIEAKAGDGLEVVQVERLAEDGSDAQARVQALLAAKPDTIVLGALMPAIGHAVGVIAASGYQGKVFLDPSAGADQLLAGSVRQAAEGMYMVHPSVLDSNTLVNTPSRLAQEAFRKRYVLEHNTFSGLAPSAYDAFQLIVNAVVKAGKTSRPAVRDALETSTHDGIAGNYAFTPAYHGGMQADSLSLFAVRNGGWSLAT